MKLYASLPLFFISSLAVLFVMGCGSEKQADPPVNAPPPIPTEEPKPKRVESVVVAPVVPAQPVSFEIEHIAALNQPAGYMELQVKPDLGYERRLRCWGQDEAGAWAEILPAGRPGRRFKVETPDAYEAFRVCVFDMGDRELDRLEMGNPDRVPPMTGDLEDVKAVESNGVLRVSFKSEIKGDGLLWVKMGSMKQELENEFGKTYELVFEPTSKKTRFRMEVRGRDLAYRVKLFEVQSVHFDGCKQLTKPEIVKIEDACESFAVHFQPATFDCPADEVTSTFYFYDQNDEPFTYPALSELPATKNQVTVSKRGMQVGEIRFNIMAFRERRESQGSEQRTVPWNFRMLPVVKSKHEITDGKVLVTTSNLPEGCELVCEIDKQEVARGGASLDFPCASHAGKSMYLFFEDACYKSPKFQRVLTSCE